MKKHNCRFGWYYFIDSRGGFHAITLEIKGEFTEEEMVNFGQDFHKDKDREFTLKRIATQEEINKFNISF